MSPSDVRPGAAIDDRARQAKPPWASFSRDVLERAPSVPAVSPLPARVVWTDWGTRERVVAGLRRAGLRPRWLEALGKQSLQSA